MQDQTCNKSIQQDTYEYQSGRLQTLLYSGLDAVRMTITPNVARVMMERNESDDWKNRPASNGGVKRFAKAMDSGRWRYTGESIIFSKSGRLIDGQHRLLAAIQTGRAFDSLVAFGADDDAFEVIDTGIARTAAHIFAIEGVPNYGFCSAAMRIFAHYQRNKTWSGSMGGGYGFRLDNDELLELYYQYPDISQSHHAAHQFKKLLAPSWAGAMHYICARIDREEADAFFSKVATGIGINSNNDPAHIIRKKMVESMGLSKSDPQRLAPGRISAYLIKCWNNSRIGKPVKQLRWLSDEPFPRAK